MQFAEFFEIVGGGFFGGNTMLAGLVILTIILALVFSFTKSAFTMLVIAMPITLVFSYMKVIPEEMTIILLVVAIVGLAFTSKEVFK